MKRVFQLSIIALGLLAFVLCPPISKTAAQTNFTGDWKAETRTEKPEKIYLSFEHRTANGRNQNGTDYEYKDLQGLTRSQATSSGTVSFSLVREAGTIQCDGKFENGKGSGTFRFTSNPSFVSAMKSRGFDFTEDKYGREDNIDNRLFSAATLNLTTAFADELNSAKFGKLTVDDLFKARIFNITPQFMSEMKATGFPNLGMEELVKSRIFKIDADYVRQLSDAGFKNESFEGLVKARIFKIDANYVKQVKAMGFKDQSMESLVKMSIFKITPEYIKEVQDQGFKDFSVEELVKLKTFKITGAFIKEIQTEGFSKLSIEQLVKMKIFKIDGAFIRKARADKADLDVEDLVQMKIGIWRK